MLFKNKIVKFYLNLIAAMKNLKWNGNNISLPHNPSFLKECLRLRKKSYEKQYKLGVILF